MRNSHATIVDVACVVGVAAQLRWSIAWPASRSVHRTWTNLLHWRAQMRNLAMFSVRVVACRGHVGPAVLWSLSSRPQPRRPWAHHLSLKQKYCLRLLLPWLSLLVVQPHMPRLLRLIPLHWRCQGGQRWVPLWLFVCLAVDVHLFGVGFPLWEPLPICTR